MGVWGEVEGKLTVSVYEPEVHDDCDKNKKVFYDSYMVVKYLNHVLESYKNALYYGNSCTKTVNEMKIGMKKFPYYQQEPFNWKNPQKCDISHCVRDVTKIWDGQFTFAVIPTHINSHSDWVPPYGTFWGEDLIDVKINRTIDFNMVDTYEIPIHVVDRNSFGETLLQFVFDLIKYLKATQDLKIDVSYDLMVFNDSEGKGPFFYTDDEYKKKFKIKYQEHHADWERDLEDL